MQTLTPELVSAVHHVELNRSGWWDSAVERLILNAVWIAGGSLAAEEIGGAILSQWSSQLSVET
jgi:hypothetical protein